MLVPHAERPLRRFVERERGRRPTRAIVAVRLHRIVMFRRRRVNADQLHRCRANASRSPRAISAWLTEDLSGMNRVPAVEIGLPARAA